MLGSTNLPSLEIDFSQKFLILNQKKLYLFNSLQVQLTTINYMFKSFKKYPADKAKPVAKQVRKATGLT